MILFSPGALLFFSFLCIFPFWFNLLLLFNVFIILGILFHLTRFSIYFSLVVIISFLPFLFPSLKEKLLKFHEYLNSSHHRIQFNLIVQNNSFLFLDILVTKKQKGYSVTVYIEKQHTQTSTSIL